MSAHGKPATPEQRAIWNAHSHARRADPAQRAKLHRYDRDYRARKANALNGVTHTALGRVKPSEYVLEHRAKKHRKLIDHVEAKPAHDVVHKQDGITDSERAVVKQLLLNDFPIADGWVHFKNNGTPDYILTNVRLHRTAFIEIKLTTDRLDAVTQQPLMLELEACGQETWIYPVSRSRK